MDVFLARQPIFNRDKKVVAYEILYRESVRNVYDPNYDGDMATTSVISDTLINFGIEGLTKSKRAFINFTRNLLMEDMPFLINPDQLIVEILENVDIDEKVIEKCQKLKDAGYSIALDDFVDNEKYLPIIDYVDIIKVDFLVLKSEGRRLVADKYKPMGLLLLAEKVETYADYEEALALGYDFFQGFFFEKPVVCKTKGINVSTFRYLEIIKETVSDVPDFSKLTDIVKNDLSLTYKLLRLINSPAFYRHTEITSVNQALTLLGINEIRKWITLIMLRDVSSDQPDEVIKVSLNRAFFAERAAAYFDLDERTNEAFLVGLFSMIDAIMEKPLFEILDELPLKEDVKSALLGMRNPFHELLRLVRFYEKGNWEMIVKVAEMYGIDCKELNEIYVSTAITATDLLTDV
ncbi:HDOD domain-containing protein [Fusibacter paucivorans]|uniref:HDOD domain-containing protein n=1 Tax=Fusibacter paucivorans TaxID=76009 RepID=A0ABS5PKS9_9FIRM|nr:HDOD domain-containing protein [Fusibacter paucivorans]MBS7525749.1 HDOD domain-containing protein [Fusibacter paucivorans]